MDRRLLPAPLARLIEALSLLPGIGEKSATRLAVHILRSSREQVHALARAIVDTKDNVGFCRRCFSFSEGEVCAICASPERDTTTVCVVEEPLELLAIERSGEYKGLYHVLHGVISPLDGVGPKELRIPTLIDRVRNEGVREVILATNPTVEGEATSHYIAERLRPLGTKVSRIAHGVPVGGSIEYMDEVTLGRALRDRRLL